MTGDHRSHFIPQHPLGAPAGIAELVAGSDDTDVDVAARETGCVLLASLRGEANASGHPILDEASMELDERLPRGLSRNRRHRASL